MTEPEMSTRSSEVAAAMLAGATAVGIGTAMVRMTAAQRRGLVEAIGAAPPAAGA